MFRSFVLHFYMIFNTVFRHGFCIGFWQSPPWFLNTCNLKKHGFTAVKQHFSQNHHCRKTLVFWSTLGSLLLRDSSFWAPFSLLFLHRFLHWFPHRFFIEKWSPKRLKWTPKKHQKKSKKVRKPTLVPKGTTKRPRGSFLTLFGFVLGSFWGHFGVIVMSFFMLLGSLILIFCQV